MNRLLQRSIIGTAESIIVNALDRKLWPHFGRALLRRLRLGGEHDDRRAEAQRWCNVRALDAAAALQRLSVAGPPMSAARRHPEIWAAAECRARHCLIPFEEMGIAGAADVDLLYTLCRHLRARRVVETGVALGWSSLAMLLAMAGDPAARLYSVDLPYTRLRAAKWVGVAVPEPYRNRWTIYRVADREGLPRALEHGPFDLCHYDSDKSVEGRCWAYPRLWTALRPGGMLVSDDVGDNHAWATFCADVQRDPFIVRSGAKHVGILVKAHDDPQPAPR